MHLVTLGKEQNVQDAAEKLYAELTARGVEVLWDDRDERPGVKFKDADLIGIPLRVTLGAKGLAFIKVEGGEWKSPIVKFFSEAEKAAVKPLRKQAKESRRKLEEQVRGLASDKDIQATLDQLDARMGTMVGHRGSPGGAG